MPSYSSTVSLQSQCSTAPLNASYTPPQKDFAAAFASLQSTYGTSGTTPMPVQRPSKPAQKYSTNTAVLPATTQQQQPAKNYELAFGNLSSSYGYGGLAPSLPAKKSSSSKSSFGSKVFSKNSK